VSQSLHLLARDYGKLTCDSIRILRSKSLARAGRVTETPVTGPPVLLP